MQTSHYDCIIENSVGKWRDPKERNHFELMEPAPFTSKSKQCCISGPFFQPLLHIHRVISDKSIYSLRSSEERGPLHVYDHGTVVLLNRAGPFQ